MNIVLDIDEAFLNSQDTATFSKVYKGWDEETQTEFDDAVSQIKFTPAGRAENSAICLMRPGWKEYFKFLFTDPRINSVNLWTWSDRPYAQKVAEIVQKEIKKVVSEEHKSKIKFLLVLGDVDVEESIEYGMENYPDFVDKTNTRDKDLRFLCDKHASKGFALSNTILIDDNIKNTRNPSNARNSINVREWNPLDDEDFYDTVMVNKKKQKVLFHVMDFIKEAHANLKDSNTSVFQDTIVVKNPKTYISRTDVVKEHRGQVPKNKTTRRAVFYGSKECAFSKEEAAEFNVKMNIKKIGGSTTRRSKTARAARIKRKR
jgi:hypothetical protein